MDKPFKIKIDVLWSAVLVTVYYFEKAWVLLLLFANDK